MSGLKLFLLGPPIVQKDNVQLKVPSKAMALLAYLAVTGESQRREKLATWLWPKSKKSSNSRANLRRELTELEKKLGSGWLDRERETVGLIDDPDDPDPLWLDVDHFQGNLGKWKMHSHTGDEVCFRCIPWLRKAVHLYRGHFMNGFNPPNVDEYRDWQLQEKQALKEKVTGAFRKLTSWYNEQGRWEEARYYAEYLMSVGEWEEATTSLFIEVITWPKPVRVIKPPDDKVIKPSLPLPQMIAIPAGEFWMGSGPEDTDAWKNEKPKRRIYLDKYYLAKTPVTNAQYEAFVQATGHPQPPSWKDGHPPWDKEDHKEDHPVVNVSWYDALAYCRWLTEETRSFYRLPSEAEWEKGARGADGRIYPWGDQWEHDKCNSVVDSRVETTPVDAYPNGVSPYDLLDMSGNVWEWTRNVFRFYPYSLEDDEEDKRMLGGEFRRWFGITDPYSATDIQKDARASGDSRRVLRGGSFSNAPREVRCAVRHSNNPNHKDCDIGFRVMRDA